MGYLFFTNNKKCSLEHEIQDVEKMSLQLKKEDVLQKSIAEKVSQQSDILKKSHDQDFLDET